MQDGSNPPKEDNVFMDMKNPSSSTPSPTSRPIVNNPNAPAPDPMISTPVSSPMPPPTPSPSPSPAAVPTGVPKNFGDTFQNQRPSISNDASAVFTPNNQQPAQPGQNQPANAPVPGQASKKKSSLLVDFIVVVVLLIIIAVLIYFIKYKKNSL